MANAVLILGASYENHYLKALLSGVIHGENNFEITLFRSLCQGIIVAKCIIYIIFVEENRENILICESKCGCGYYLQRHSVCLADAPCVARCTRKDIADIKLCVVCVRFFFVCQCTYIQSLL